MTPLGADISDLTADMRTAAAKGLSIVVPCYNEGAGLTLLHERIAALAAKLKQAYGLATEGGSEVMRGHLAR